MPTNFCPAGPLVLRVTPCGGQPIEQPLDDWRFDPDDPRASAEFNLGIEGVGIIPMRIVSWSPLHAIGCGRAENGKPAKVEILGQ